MKRQRGRGGHTQESLKNKFSKVHTERSKSTTKVMYRKNSKLKEVSADNSVLVVDENSTNNTDGSCSVILEKSFYDFLENKLPEEILVTKAKLNFIQQLLSNSTLSPFVKQELAKFKIREFIDNLLLGEYNQVHQDMVYFSRALEENILSIKQNIIIKVKDSNENVFTTTLELNRVIVNENFISIIKCPIDDSDTSNKDGFTGGETMYFYLKSINSNIEIPLNITANQALTAADKKEIIITSIDIDQKFYNVYNPEIIFLENNI